MNNNIATLRKVLDISQRELGRRINMSGQYIAKIEKGDRKPTLETLNKIATALEVDITELVDRPKLLNEILLDHLREGNWDFEELFDYTGIANQQFKNALTSIRRIDSDTIKKIGTYLGYSEDYMSRRLDLDSKIIKDLSDDELLRLEKDLTNKISLLFMYEYIYEDFNDKSDKEKESVVNDILFNNYFKNLLKLLPIDRLQRTLCLDSKQYFQMESNDSMNLVFSEGSELIVEVCTEFIDGKLSVVSVGDCNIKIRKIAKNGNIITLIPLSTNPEYLPEIFDLSKDEIKILGIVKTALSFY